MNNSGYIICVESVQFWLYHLCSGCIIYVTRPGDPVLVDVQISSEIITRSPVVDCDFQLTRDQSHNVFYYLCHFE